MQAVDFTTLSAAVVELKDNWLPARIEQIRQDDYQTIRLLLKTLGGQRWLLASCHPQAARLHFVNSGGEAARSRTTRFAFASTLHQHLVGQVLVRCEQPAWERVVQLGFARRPEEPPQVQLYVEVMGKYSNIVLCDQQGQILAVAHSVSTSQSRVRPVQLGEIYRPPPPLTGPAPSRSESFLQWRSRLEIVPKPVGPLLVQTYRSVSQVLASQLLTQAKLGTQIRTDELSEADWQAIWQLWQQWLTCLEENRYQSGWSGSGYTVLGWNLSEAVPSLHLLLEHYYTEQLQAGLLNAKRSRLKQALKVALARAVKREHKQEQMIVQAGEVERYKQVADLLMAHLNQTVPGARHIQLADFETGCPVRIDLDPTKDLVGNAQAYYRRHRKAKRTRQSVEPLLAQTREEIAYLEQVAATVELLSEHSDLGALLEVETELVQQEYLDAKEKPAATAGPVPFEQFALANGSVVLVGRNNRQNEQLTFEVAAPTDLWFHAQEIPGSHVVPKVPAGERAEAEAVQLAANLAAYYSRARHSAHVPVIYTERRHVRKLRGARPGLVTFRDEKVIWAAPDQLPPQAPEPEVDALRHPPSQKNY